MSIRDLLRWLVYPRRYDVCHLGLSGPASDWRLVDCCC
jgi:hypothetical protein